jgi:hypothetical protein
MTDEVMSPPSKKETVVEPARLKFGEALLFVVTGKKIAKLEWNNDDYGFMGKDGFLKIFRNGNEHNWKVSDGDILGEDYVVLEEPK